MPEDGALLCDGVLDRCLVEKGAKSTLGGTPWQDAQIHPNGEDDSGKRVANYRTETYFNGSWLKLSVLVQVGVVIGINNRVTGNDSTL